MEEDSPLGFGRSTHGEDHQVSTKQKPSRSHTQTRRFEEIISALPYIEWPSLVP